jgi:hypothetical protein
MTTFNKFQDFVEQLGKGLHNLDTAEFRVYLSNEQPLAADTVKADIADLSTGGGYTALGEDIQNAFTETSGTGTMTAVDVEWTATTGFGPFQFAIIYNNTATNKNLFGWYDRGSALTLGAGEKFKVDFGASLAVLGP